MSNVIFTREVTNAILGIAFELKRMNDLKEKEMDIKYGSWMKED